MICKSHLGMMPPVFLDKILLYKGVPFRTERLLGPPRALQVRPLALPMNVVRLSEAPHRRYEEFP